jgi:nucleoside-diphosphate-sugar epimerase
MQENSMDSNKQHCLVTGGSGFVGKALVLLLLENNWKVSVLDSREPDYNGDFTFIKGDIRNYNDCISATKLVDCVFHVAAVVPLGKNSQEIYDVNVNGTDNLLKSSEFNKVKKFVFVSSSAVYGVPKSLPVTHDSKMKPIEPYGKSKLTAEKLCLTYLKSSLLIQIVRPRTILGPGRLGIFGTFFELFEKYGSILMIGKANPKYQFVHINDLCQGIINASNLPIPSILNLGNLEFGYLEDEFRALGNFAHKTLKIRHLPERVTRITLLALCKIKILPFAAYQIKIFGKSFYFDSKLDWKKLNYYPKHSNFYKIALH